MITRTGEPVAPRRASQWLAAACLLAWVAFVGAAALRPRPIEFDPWLDVGLYDLAFAGRRRRVHRPVAPAVAPAVRAGR